MAQHRRGALPAIPLVLVMLALGAVQMAGALRDPFVRHGADATGTILATGEGPHDQRWAQVRFAGPAGPVVTTIAVCHHQAYGVGGTVPVVYDPRHPDVAAERHMHPTLDQALSGPGVLLLMGLAGAVAIGLVLRRRPEEVVAEDAVALEQTEPVETPAEWLEDVLVTTDA